MYINLSVRVHLYVYIGITGLCSRSHLHQGSGEPLASQDPVQVKLSSKQQTSI